MADLEPIRSIIPKVFDAAADAAERRHVTDELNRLVPAGPEPERDDLTIYAEPGPAPLPWPTGLQSRLAQILEAAQCLDADTVIRITLGLMDDTNLIQRQEEHIALRRRQEPR